MKTIEKEREIREKGRRDREGDGVITPKEAVGVKKMHTTKVCAQKLE